MRVRSKAELLQALTNTETLIKECGVNAQDFYVHRQVGIAHALRFALGYSQEENNRLLNEVEEQSAYFLKKRLDLARVHNGMRKL